MPLQEFYKVEIFKVGQALQSRDEVVGPVFVGGDGLGSGIPSFVGKNVLKLRRRQSGIQIAVEVIACAIGMRPLRVEQGVWSGRVCGGRSLRRSFRKDENASLQGQ